MSERQSAGKLLIRAGRIFDVPGNPLPAAAAAAWRGGFASGGEWMRIALSAISLRPDLRLSARIETPPTPGTNEILCAHNPAIFPAARRAGYRLVLAGHLHGGQCVLATRRGRLYPGAWFARWTGLRFSEGDSTMLVSRGAADTLPLRWNCPREVIVCEIV